MGIKNLHLGEIEKTKTIVQTTSTFRFLVHDDDLHEFESSQVYKNLSDWLQNHERNK